MINDELSAWAAKAWEAEVLKNMPAAKAVRQLKTSNRESKKALVRARRSLAASQASSQRKLNQRLTDIEREFRDRREARDAEFEQKRWAVLVGESSS